MTPEEEDLARALVALGCPAEKAADMAAHLERRAGQLAAKTGRTLDEARAHLLRLMAGGWASRSRDARPDPDFES